MYLRRIKISQTRLIPYSNKKYISVAANYFAHIQEGHPTWKYPFSISCVISENFDKGNATSIQFYI